MFRNRDFASLGPLCDSARGAATLLVPRRSPFPGLPHTHSAHASAIVASLRSGHSAAAPDAPLDLPRPAPTPSTPRRLAAPPSLAGRQVAEVHDDDLVIELNEAVVLIDETSLQFLGGAKIDYVEDLMAAAFKIENPNASSACGCGTSFAI